MQSSFTCSNSNADNISSPEEPNVPVSTTTIMCTAMVSAGSGRLQFSGDKLSMTDDISEDEPEGAEGFTVLSSPCVDLGRDFELLVSQCIAEKKAREGRRSQEIADDICIKETGANSGSYTDVTTKEVDTPKEVTMASEKTDKSSEAVTAASDVTEKPVDEDDAAGISQENESKMVDNQSNSVTEQLAEAMLEDVIMDLTDDCEWPILGCGCSKVESLKPSVGTAKPQVKKAMKTKRAKKWKPVSQVQLGFNYSVLLHQQYVDESEEDEMDAELLEFEKVLSDAMKEEDENKEKQAEEKDKPAEAKKSKSANKRVRKCKNRLKKNASQNSALHDDLPEDVGMKIIMDTTDSKMSRIVSFEGSHRSQIRLRRKHKWRHEKTRKAIKFKQCKDFGVRSPGKAIYFSSHMHKNIQGVFWRVGHNLPKPKSHQGYKDVKSVATNPIYAAGAHGKVKHPAPRQNYPVAKPVPRHTLNENNADAEIPADILNVLMALQDRELTPEDYEILLRLDERVKPKTLEEDVLDSFRTEEVTLECAQSGGEPCAVCLDPYVEGQFRKFLPCGHGFHGDCIDMWLKNSSMNCPLDGLPVTEN